jgi:hypothetical protein
MSESRCYTRKTEPGPNLALWKQHGAESHADLARNSAPGHRKKRMARRFTGTQERPQPMGVSSPISSVLPRNAPVVRCSER